MTFRRFENNEDETWRSTRSHLNPSQVDQGIRSALHLCWMLIPPSKRSSGEVERQFRRLVDRAIRDMQEDDENFA